MLGTKNCFLKFAVITLCFTGSLSLINAQPRGNRAGTSATAETNKELWGALRYRFIGPVGNRLTSVVGVPGPAKYSPDALFRDRHDMRLLNNSELAAQHLVHLESVVTRS